MNSIHPAFEWGQELHNRATRNGHSLAEWREHYVRQLVSAKYYSREQAPVFIVVHVPQRCDDEVRERKGAPSDSGA
ncbi:MAG: hypothetical protein WKF55_08270 [Gemmatimonadaceae bacterium]